MGKRGSLRALLTAGAACVYVMVGSPAARAR